MAKIYIGKSIPQVTGASMSKTYPLKLDSQVYDNLKALCAIKGITIKDGLRQAIALLLADNLTLIEVTPKENATEPKSNGENNLNQ